jgi:inner membrane protein
LLGATATHVLFPLSRWRASIGTTFLIDPLFTGIVVAGLMLGVVRRHFWATRTALVVLRAYVASQGCLQQRALNVGREQAAPRRTMATRLLKTA